MTTLEPHDVVAFLQNPWFAPETDAGTIERYRTDVNFRRHVLSETMTGKRLLRAFGKEWFFGIWWDNANPTHGAHHRERWTPDPAHMMNVVSTHYPRLVLLFGRSAETGAQIAKIDRVTRTLACAHPNAMGVTQEEFDLFAMRVMNTRVE